MKERTTIAPETESSKTRVARKVYRYRDAELARFELLEGPPPPLPPGGPDEGVGVGAASDDMTRKKKGPALR